MTSEHIQATLDRIDSLSSKKLFFLIGVPRSGTTWLQHALNNHDEIRCLGESHFVDILYRNLQKSFQTFNKNIYQQGGTVAHLREFGGHVNTLSYDTQDLNLLLYYSMYIIFDRWVDSPGISIVGEKTPENIRALNLLSSVFPDSQFVHIIRDARDCAVSGWFFNISGLDKGKSVAQRFDSYVTGFVKQWKTEIDLAKRVGDQLGARYFELTFENMIENPTKELEKVCRFLGAATDKRIVARCIGDARFEALSGGRRAGIEDNESFFRKGVSGDWRNHFQPQLAERVWSIAGDTLNRLGYPRK